MANKKNSQSEDNTYIGEGMLYGVTCGTLIGAMISIFSVTNIIYLPICVSIGIAIGSAIGSNIKKK